MMPMFSLEEIAGIGKECGFTYVAPLDADTIELNTDVRKMCESNSCGMYGANWCCPPGMGDLGVCEEKIRKYKRGVLVQTVGELEDELDGETMMETEAAHKKHFDAMHRRLLEIYPGLLACGAGTCTRCKKCTYPDAPCRFPDKLHPSIESYGVEVNVLARSAHVRYNNGPNTVTFFSCIFFNGDADQEVG